VRETGQGRAFLESDFGLSLSAVMNLPPVTFRVGAPAEVGFIANGL
jgi:hypothetical protein